MRIGSRAARPVEADGKDPVGFFLVSGSIAGDLASREIRPLPDLG